MTDKIKVAFLGPEGTHSHRATVEIFGNQFNEVLCSEFESVFAKVENGDAKFAVVPIENNTAGMVDKALDLLILSDLKIIAETKLFIHQSLLSMEDKLDKIQKLYSLPQPYFQCQLFIEKHLPDVEWIQSSSSSQAVQECLAHPEASAAIAYADSGVEQGLKVLSKNIQDLKDNSTRFVILSRGEKLPNLEQLSNSRKTSIVFTLEDRPGTLLEILNIFQKYELNMCHIESRPTRLKKWNYYFFITLENELAKEDLLKSAIQEVVQKTPWNHDLGTYGIIQSGCGSE